MTTRSITVKAYLYFWVNSDGTLGDPQLSQYRCSSENWITPFKDAEGHARLIEQTVEVPEGFYKNWQAEAVAACNAEESRIRAETQARLASIWELKEKLLALEFVPSGK